MRSKQSVKARGALAAVGATALCVGALVAGPLMSSAQAAGTTNVTASLPACGFWAPDVTAPARSVTPWVAPLQTATAFNFSTRQTAPTITGAMVNGQETITVSPVPNAVAYKVWRDGVDIGYISYWGQTGPLTVTDTAPCQNAYYDVIAMYDTNNDDASYGQLSVPYWLNNDGTVSPGNGNVAPGTTLSNFMITSYDNTGPTATGYNAQSGICATDPRVIPWGTYFSIPDYGTCMAGDLGTWIQGDIVDVWLPNPQAGNWGVQKRTITIIANPYASATTPASPSPSTATTPASPSPSAVTTSASPSPSTVTTSASPTPTSSGNCTAAAWDASATYSSGQVVSYNGHNYTATWTSVGAVPNAATSWAVWTDNGAC